MSRNGAPLAKAIAVGVARWSSALASTSKLVCASRRPPYRLCRVGARAPADVVVPLWAGETLRFTLEVG